MKNNFSIEGGIRTPTKSLNKYNSNKTFYGLGSTPASSYVSNIVKNVAGTQSLPMGHFPTVKKSSRILIRSHNSTADTSSLLK